MDIHVINQTKNKTENEEKIINFPVSLTIGEFKSKIKQNFNLKIPLSNIGLSILFPNNQNKISITSDSHTLDYYSDFSDPQTKIYVKNLGPQISYRTVYIIEYLGPFLFTILFYINLYKNKTNQKLNVPTIQNCFFFMSFFHYLKRIIETIFVHEFSRDTMPIKNLFKNCAYYWFLFGLLCNYYLFNSNYNTEFLLFFRYFFIAFFISAELKNLKCHLILKEMKEKHKGKKGIPPPKEGFEYVTCANYFWEFLAWFCFSIVSLHWSVFLFTCCGFYQMREWAIKKHKEIKKAFGDKYPKERKAFIPFFI